MRLTPSCSSLDGLLTHIQHHVLGATTRGATLERVVVQRLPHITPSTAPWPSHHPFTAGDRYTVSFTLQQPSAMLHDVRAAPSSFPSSYLSALQRGLPKHTIRVLTDITALPQPEKSKRQPSTPSSSTSSAPSSAPSSSQPLSLPTPTVTSPAPVPRPRLAVTFAPVPSPLL